MSRIGLAALLFLGLIAVDASAGVQCLDYERSGNLIRASQEELNRRDFHAGAADGIWGQKTMAAVAAFQRDQGIQVHETVRGQLTYKTLVALFGELPISEEEWKGLAPSYLPDGIRADTCR